MPIHIANDTKQHHVVSYRLRGEDSKDLQGPFYLEIPSGRQIDVGHGWAPRQRQFFIEQIEQQGARDAAEAHAKMGKHLGLLYRDNGVIEEDEIKMGHDQVVDTQERRSAQQATRAAAGFDRAVNGATRGKRKAKETEVEVEQLNAPHERPKGDEVAFKIGFDSEGRAPLPSIA